MWTHRGVPRDSYIPPLPVPGAAVCTRPELDLTDAVATGVLIVCIAVVITLL